MAVARMTDPILITGAARSGTSMVTGVLHAWGLKLGGPLVKATSQNPKGFFEHRAIRQRFLKPLLRSHGFDPRGQRVLPPRDFRVGPAHVVRLRKRFLQMLGPGKGYKDAKIILIWRVFEAMFPNARWILVRRDPKSIVDSCIRCPFMKGRAYKAGWVEWVQEHEFRFADLKASGANVFEIWPDPTDSESFRELIAFAGLRFERGLIEAALVPEAYSMQRAG
jgi:hypothetical protein